MGALSIVWTVLLVAFNPSQNALNDSISAIGFAIAFYYGFVGFASAWYFRRAHMKTLKGIFLRVGRDAAPRRGKPLLRASSWKALGDFSLANPVASDRGELDGSASRPADRDLIRIGLMLLGVVH